MALLMLLLPLATAQDTITLNGLTWMLPSMRNFTYFQGGLEWPDCETGRQQESPIDVQENPTDGSVFQVISENGTRFVPLEFQNQYIGDNFQLLDVAGVQEFFVMAGTARWNIPGGENTQFLMMINVIAPSAHFFNGYQYPLELRLYYATPRPDANLMVMSYVAIWFEEDDEDSPFIQQLIDQSGLDVSLVYPTSGILDDYFFYTGTEDRPFPMCYPDIGVVIPNYVLGISRTQLDYYNNMYMNNATFAGGRGTNRLIQPHTNPVYHFISNQTETPVFADGDTVVSFLQ